VSGPGEGGLIKGGLQKVHKIYKEKGNGVRVEEGGRKAESRD